jgi:GntP family gluconate:H+ symporter
MNDSGFWIISRMSGLTVGETIKSFSVMQCVMSLTGLAAILVLAKLFPLI